MTDEFDIPKVILLLFEKSAVPLVCVCVPAAIPTPPPAAEAVITDPFKPNDTPFELENVNADRLLEVVPAETLMLVRLVATEPVKTEPFRPKLTLLPLLNVNAERLLLVVPALTLIA